jgi:tRNA-splicing ligase RtcB (3'-phosphate/5'-hydroxy nucleic acid ligase)
MAQASWGDILEQIDAQRWRIPRSYKPEMQTDGIIYASEQMIDAIRKDNSPAQVANVACLPGIVGSSLAMPDIHYGYGFCIGGVAAMDTETGVVSPGGVGYDINCGVRLLRSDLTINEVKPKIRQLIHQLFRDVPSGVGSKGRIRAEERDLKRVMEKGAAWAVAEGYGWPEDLLHTESKGCIADADPEQVSPRAKERGQPQLGTLGAGNHFLEVQYVEQIFDEKVARIFGLTEPGQITVMIHTGSRGFGYQICDDFLVVMQKAVQKYGLQLPDRQLACAPFASDEAQRYLGAMRAAANYAWCNRQCIAHWTRLAFERVFASSARHIGLYQIYDVAHNIAKVEEHEVNGQWRTLCVHRKGATRAFPAGHSHIPKDYKSVGQPVIVPGDMGRYSYLLVGTERAMQETWGSTCHGAGRMLSRSAAIKNARGRDIAEELAAKGIHAEAASSESLAEEMPQAYKDVDLVVDTCVAAGISRKVARLKPLGVMKG